MTRLSRLRPAFQQAKEMNNERYSMPLRALPDSSVAALQHWQRGFIFS